MNNIITIEQLKQELSFGQVRSLSVTNNLIDLLDFEVIIRKNYYIRFNDVSKKYEIAVSNDLDQTIDWEELVFAELFNDLVRGSAKGKGKLTEGELKSTLSDRRIVPRYDPFVGYFNFVDSYLPSDDTGGYIDDLASCLVVEGGEAEQTRWKTSFKKALVRTVKCAVNDKYFNKQCLTLYSKNQNVGKTSFLRFLVPDKLKKYYYEGAIGGDKDSQTVLGKNFIVMIDELANLSKLDINVLKALISKLTINIRLPYAETFGEFPRRASFFATTNRGDFLTDSENSRWLIFDVKSIDKRYGNIFTGEYQIDINKVWCEAYRLYLNGYPCEMSVDDLASNEVNNVSFAAESLEEEVINTYFSHCNNKDNHLEGFKKLVSGDIFELACQYLEADQKLNKLKALNQKYFFNTLSKKWKRSSMRIDGKVVSGYYLIDLKCVKNKTDLNLPF